MAPVVFASFALPAAAALGAAAAVAVPVLVHLLSRQRYQVVPWAAVRFLVAAQKKHRRRIDRWALLAVRILALLLPLAGMCAVAPWAESAWQAVRPGTPEVVSTAPRTHHVLLMDASLSLSAKAGDTNRFEKAVALAEQAVRNASPGDGFTLIQLAGPAQTIVPGPSNDAEKVVLELRSLRVTHGTADLAAGLSATADALARSPRAYPRRQVLLFTDLQRSAFAGLLPRPDGPPPDVWQRVLPRADFAVVNVADADADNLAVVDLALADPLPLADAPAAVTAALHNFGKADRKQVRVELSVGRPSAGGPETTLLPIEQRMIDSIPAGQRVGVTFALDGATRFREPGLHLIRLKILDEDALPADDVRTLAVDVRAGLPVVLVNGTPNTDPLNRASGFLSEALDPGGRKLSVNPARPRTVSPAEFADTALGDLSGADAVFLCDVPNVTTAQAAKLDAHLKRGGGVVIGLGPNAAANLDAYNRVLFADGNGLLPGKLLGVKAADEVGFRLAADDDAYRRPPLAVFRDDNARAGLVSVPFKKYVRLDAPADGRARRILSFVPAKAAVAPPGSADEDRPDPAVVEWPRHRGRVVVYTSTFNTEWTDWPVLPSFLPFAHELLRFAAANPDRHTVRVGEPIEEFLPPATVGLTATVTGPENLSATVPVIAGDEVGLARFADTSLSGLYRMTVGGRRDSVFAVNVPEATAGGGSESDLRRLDPADLRAVGPVQVVESPNEVKVGGDGEAVTTLVARPHGPTVARYLLAAAALLMVLELWLAWRLGPARTALPGTANRTDVDPTSKGRRLLRAAFGFGPVVVAGAVLVTVVHAESTGDLLGFAPDSWRAAAERFVGVPAAGPGRGHPLAARRLPRVPRPPGFRSDIIDRFADRRPRHRGNPVPPRTPRRRRDGPAGRAVPAPGRHPRPRRVRAVAAAPARLRPRGLAGRGRGPRHVRQHGHGGRPPRPGRQGEGRRTHRAGEAARDGPAPLGEGRADPAGRRLADPRPQRTAVQGPRLRPGRPAATPERDRRAGRPRRGEG